MNEAKKIAIEMGLNLNFCEKRAEKRRIQFDKCGEEDVISLAEQSFILNHFVCY